MMAETPTESRMAFSAADFLYFSSRDEPVHQVQAMRTDVTQPNLYKLLSYPYTIPTLGLYTPNVYYVLSLTFLLLLTSYPLTV